MSQYFLYIFKCSDGTFYTGITTDVKRRIKEHNGEVKGGAKYTRVRTPVKLVHSEKYSNRSAATKREHEIKQLKLDEKSIIINMDYYKFVQNRLKKSPKKKDSRFNPERYMGTSHKFLGMTNPEKHKLAAEFKKQFPNITFGEMVKLLDKLNLGETFEDKTIGPMILMRFPKLIEQIEPKNLDLWLSNLEGWCEIDTLCQSTFQPEIFLNNWNVWEKALTKWSKDKNVSKRRASLVLLCKSVGKSTDLRLCNLAFGNVERLKSEKDILITKAISWILRNMTKNFAQNVEKYINENETTLPKIAIRETRKKLITGRK